MSDPGAWQEETLRRLFALSYDGFSFGPGTIWSPIKGGKKMGSFKTTEAFDAWLAEREGDMERWVILTEDQFRALVAGQPVVLPSGTDRVSLADIGWTKMLDAILDAIRAGMHEALEKD